ncbi:C40 family peptidase [Schaalia georgiae]|nr:C40 family peptidase [Schaalia georgiae]
MKALPQLRGRIRLGLAALAAVAALTVPQMAQAAPSEDDIAKAQAAEEAAKLSVAEIEVRLAQVSAQAQSATQAAQVAGEDLNAANIALDQAKATSAQAQADAAQAQADFEEGKKQIASIAQTAYRDGNASLDALAPYLDSDGLRTVETKKSSIDSFSNSAETKMQNVAALEQVANVMRGAAEQALTAQQSATDEVQARTDAANAAASSAQAQQRTVEAQRSAYVEELAKKQNTTVDLIQQREAALEAERQAAAEAAARAAAEAAAQAAAEEAARQAAAAQAAPAPSVGGGDDDDSDSGYTPPSRTPEIEDSSDDDGGGSSWGSGGAATAIAAAKSYLGVPYVWGGESYGGVDCSGLTMLAWARAGVSLPHLSRAQYGYGTHVSINSMEPGDLIFWSSNGAQSGIYHVAMYLGGGQMIEAPTFGVPVRITGVYSWGSIMPYAVRL